MVVCRYWSRGECRKGDSCTFEHPGANRNRFNSNNNYNSNSTNHYNGSNSRNPFNALSNDAQNGGNQGPGTSRPNDNLNNYVLPSLNELKDDLGNPPIWTLSCYGPGKDCPRQLFGGEAREISFEEARLRYLELVRAGREGEARALEDKLRSEAEAQMRNAYSDVNGAQQYIRAGEQEHPNRQDICRAGSMPSTGPISQGTSPFGQQAAASAPAPAPGGSAFGQASQLKNPFGQPSQPAGAFGQPSQPASAFGQPSQPTSAFGQPSQVGGAFGKPLQPTNPFGQPSQPASAFGQPSQPGNAFGQPSQLGGAFGQKTQPPANPFGQPSQLNQPNSSQASQPAQSAFGQPSQPSNPFGKPSQAAGSAFGQPSQPTNPFGQAKPPAATAPSNPFNQNQTSTQSSPFGQASRPGNAQEGAPRAGGFTTTSGQASGHFDGKPISYKKDANGVSTPYVQVADKRWQKVWFPDGKTFNKPEDPPIGQYTSEVEEMYKQAKQQGGFQDCLMPELPPKRDWISWTL